MPKPKPRTYPEGTKERLLDAVREGQHVREAARQLGINRTTAGNWSRIAGLGRKALASKAVKAKPSADLGNDATADRAAAAEDPSLSRSSFNALKEAMDELSEFDNFGGSIVAYAENVTLVRLPKRGGR